MRAGATLVHKEVPKANILKVLLINPPQHFDQKVPSEGLAPPLGLLYLRAMMPDYDVSILDLSILNDPQEAFHEAITKAWDAIGITILTYCLDSVKWIVEEIKAKQLEVYLIAGGVHASLLPSECLRMGFDAVVVGDGEHVISRAIAERLKGIIRGYRGGHIDDLPFPDRTCINNTRYGRFAFFRLHGLSTSIVTSRGCPFNCHFCSRLVKQSQQRRSVQSVIAELTMLQSQGFDNIFIADDYFMTNKQWLISFASVLEKEHLQFNFFYQTRIDNFNRAIAQILRKIGTQYISFGIESIHPSILTFYNKTPRPSQWQHHIKRALQACNDAGIYSQASLIIGAPMETEEMFWESFHFVQNQGADTINVNPLTYMIGSQLWQDAVQNGVINSQEYLVSVTQRPLSPIPPQRIKEICSATFDIIAETHQLRILGKTLRHLDLFRLNLLLYGIKNYFSWNFLGGNWRRHSQALKAFGYGKHDD